MRVEMGKITRVELDRVDQYSPNATHAHDVWPQFSRLGRFEYCKHAKFYKTNLFIVKIMR